jgi:hypothetical protein
LNQVDLLTTVLHELGHVLGFDDDHSNPESGHLMNGWLDTGVRRELTPAVLDRLFAGTKWLENGGF